MRRGPEPGKVYNADGETVRIGRGRRNEVIIHDNEVSREHCELVRHDDYYLLKDVGSSNGTFVNGQRVDDEGWLLKSDCIIEIGDSITLEYIVEDSGMDFAAPTMQHPYVIVFVDSGNSSPQVFPLDDDVVTIGRDLTSTIVIQEPEVSRQHLRLHYSDVGYVAEDLGSTNGTAVNGEELDSTRLLRLNDIIQIGTMVKLLYTDDPSRFLGESKTDILGSGSPDDDTLSRNVISDAKMLAKLKQQRRSESSELGYGFQPGSLVGSIMIAYARSDWTAVVANLYAYLEDHGQKVWVDQYLTRDSDDWEIALNHALSESKVLLVVVSPASLDTEYVRRAARYFRSREKPILLLMYETVSSLPIELRNLRAVDFDPEYEHDSYMELVAEIMRLGL
jgi:pSer/pThr/pTyr-binding forkhead associated (FHA) protein